MDKSKRIAEKIIVVSVALTLLLGVTSFSARCQDISNNVLRLHILANSDSDADQALKIKVRNAVLDAGHDTFSGAKNAEEAEKQILKNSNELLEVARQVIKEEGYDYDVKLVITDDNFPTRTYNDVTLPAGRYRAVRMVIGEGEGHNWWCVMFPALCLPGASSDSLDEVLTDGEMRLVKSVPKEGSKTAIRFKSVEVANELASSAKGVFNSIFKF